MTRVRSPIGVRKPQQSPSPSEVKSHHGKSRSWHLCVVAFSPPIFVLVQPQPVVLCLLLPLPCPRVSENYVVWHSFCCSVFFISMSEAWFCICFSRPVYSADLLLYVWNTKRIKYKRVVSWFDTKSGRSKMSNQIKRRHYESTQLGSDPANFFSATDNKDPFGKLNAVTLGSLVLRWVVTFFCPLVFSSLSFYLISDWHLFVTFQLFPLSFNFQDNPVCSTNAAYHNNRSRSRCGWH